MKHILRFIFLTFSVTLNAQNITITGIVKDSLTNNIIENATIHVLENNVHVHTNKAGIYSLDLKQCTNYTIEFENKGYKDYVTKIVTPYTDTTIINISIAPIYNTLQEVTIAADRPVSAASSTYISQSDFANRPKNSAQDLLRLVPGLFIAQHAGGGKAEQIFIRGFDCDHGTDIATFVDGIPVNMPSHGHGQGYADLHFLIPEVVEDMNVFKGTSSPFYGDFATGAAVNFKTLDSIPKNILQLETGSVPQTNKITSNRVLALLKVPFNSSNVSTYFAIDVINNSGFFNINQDFKRATFFSKTTYYINKYSKLQFAASGFGSSWNASGQIPERAVNEGIISRYGSIDPNEGGTTQRNNYNLTYTSKVGLGEFETQAYISTYRFKLFSDFTFFLEDSINGDMIEQGDNRTVRGINTKYTLPHNWLNMQNKFTIGASYRADEIENQLWHAPARVRMTVKANAHIHQRSNSIYANEVMRFSSKFRAELGLRYDYFIFDVEDLLPTDSAHTNYSGFNYQSAFNPKVNFIYSASNRMQFFFNTGSGFHSNDARSTVQDKFNHQLPLAISSELGTLLHIKKALISAAVWAMDMSNELVYVGDDGTTENRGPSRRYGVDMSARLPISKHLYFDADINLSNSRYISAIYGKQLATNYYIPLAPTVTSTGGITYKTNNGFEATARYRYLQARPANEKNTITARGYKVFDVTANYKIKNYKLGLVVENILNTNWNEAQFATETRLRNETKPVDELHFTTGTPLYINLILACMF